MKTAEECLIEKQEAMLTYGLDDCCRFDGMSVPPLCAVQPILGCRCLPCHLAANRASSRLSKEWRDIQNVILCQEHDHLQVLLDYYRNLSSDHDAENDALKAVISEKQKERAELARRHDIQQQQWERRG